MQRRCSEMNVLDEAHLKRKAIKAGKPRIVLAKINGPFKDLNLSVMFLSVQFLLFLDFCALHQKCK